MSSHYLNPDFRATSTYEAALVKTVKRLHDVYDVTLKPLAPVDLWDMCEHCGRPESSVESTSDGHRFCDARCAETYYDNRNEAQDQRNISRFYGGD